MSEPGRKWDGKSRIPTDTYKKNFDEIFKKKKEDKEEDKDQLKFDFDN